jgi:enamine deaminase RidA (YjgF/YER057c/UK114 family)
LDYAFVLSFESFLRCGVWLDDARDFWTFNKVYAEYFGGEFAPSRACVQSSMMVDCKVEIDCVCYKKLNGNFNLQHCG